MDRDRRTDPDDDAIDDVVHPDDPLERFAESFGRPKEPSSSSPPATEDPDNPDAHGAPIQP
jgi:hypothetical protein